MGSYDPSVGLGDSKSLMLPVTAFVAANRSNGQLASGNADTLNPISQQRATKNGELRVLQKVASVGAGAVGLKSRMAGASSTPQPLLARHGTPSNCRVWLPSVGRELHIEPHTVAPNSVLACEVVRPPQLVMSGVLEMELVPVQTA